MSGFKIIVYRLRGVFRDNPSSTQPKLHVDDRFGHSLVTIMPTMHGLIHAVGDYRLATRLDTALGPNRQKQFGCAPIKIQKGK